MTGWVFHDHADGYLLAAAHYLARAARDPEVGLLPAPSVVATLYCAFAAEAYVNVALVRLLGEDEYKPMDRVPVRSKYFLATRLGMREAWFAGGERALRDVDSLMQQRNRLVHAQPSLDRLNREKGAEPEPYEDLANVARWLSATAEVVSRLGKSHGDLHEFGRVADRLLELDPVLDSFDSKRDGPALDAAVRHINQRLVIADNEDFLDDEELQRLIDEQDPDWDVPTD